MRVVFLTHNYPRWPGDLSGAFLGTLAAALVRRGVEVRVVAPSDAGQGGEEEVDGVPVRRVRYAVGPARDPGLPGYDGRRAPGSGRLARARRGSGARSGAPPARRWPPAPT